MHEPSPDAARRLIDDPSYPAGTWACDLCSYDLRGTIRADLRRCPECGNEFSVRSLLTRQQQEPPTLRQDEVRISGRVLFFITIVGLLVLLAVLLALFGPSGRPF